MTVSYRNTLFAAAAALTVPFAASAATVDSFDVEAGVPFTGSWTLQPGEELTLNFTALNDLDVTNLSVSGTGNGSGADVAEILFGITYPPGMNFMEIAADGTAGAGLSVFPGPPGIVTAGTTLTGFFGGAFTQAVSVTLSFTSVAPSQVPVPAAGLLLGSALLGGGFAASRKKKKAA